MLERCPWRRGDGETIIFPHRATSTNSTIGAEAPPLAKKPNYGFEKRKKEMDRKAKKDAKREDRRRREEAKTEDAGTAPAQDERDSEGDAGTP